MMFRKKQQKILLVHSQAIETLGGAELSMLALVSSAPAEVTFEVILPDDPITLADFDTIILSNMRPSGGQGEFAEYRWALEWTERLLGYRGYVIRLEHDCHPCTYRDARCVNFELMDGAACDCKSPIPAAFEALYNICDAVVFLSPLHRKVINQIIDIKVSRQFDIAPPVDFDKFRSVTPFNERKQAALITGDANRIADNAVALAEAEGYPLEHMDYLSVPYEQMPELLNQYQAVVVAPVMLHAFARLVTEAMACGCKVITNNRVGAVSFADPVDACRRSNAEFWEVINRRPFWPHRRWFARKGKSMPIRSG